MKAVTLVCAIVFTLSAALAIYNFSQMIPRFRLPTVQYFSQGVWILAQCSLVIFFFTLYSRQK
jgi:uncharacterized BrkB/YihY/UPF0761 family membrane protein